MCFAQPHGTFSRFTLRIHKHGLLRVDPLLFLVQVLVGYTDQGKCIGEFL